MNSWRTPLCGWETSSPALRDPDDCLRRRSIIMRLVAKLPIIWELLMDKINNRKCENGEKIDPHCIIHSLFNTGLCNCYAAVLCWNTSILHCVTMWLQDMLMRSVVDMLVMTFSPWRYCAVCMTERMQYTVRPLTTRGSHTYCCDTHQSATHMRTHQQYTHILTMDQHTVKKSR